MTVKIGSLCTGYGGLDMAVEAVLDARTAWVSDIDKGACKVLAHRFPGVPNIGDMTSVDWTQVEPVDVITGGTPCQDLSHAGKRAGMTEGTRSNLWVSMREAIATIRPGLVVWENVAGAYSAEADSELVSNPRLLADTRRRDGEPVLRALGRVLGDLSSLGYVGGWHGLRAADIGAPHGRLRVFVVAQDSGVEREGEWTSPSLLEPRGGSTVRPLGPDMRDLLPTPAVNDMGASYTPDEWDAWCETQKANHGNGNGHGKSLSIEAQRLLPTPMTAYSGRDPEDWRAGRPAGNGGTRDAIGDLEVASRESDRWGQYAAAIARWESITREAPAPTELGAKGNPRLSPLFTEWMMGLPAGWITDVPGVTRNEALKLCGNGVVPQQAEAALRYLLPLIAEQVAA